MPSTQYTPLSRQMQMHKYKYTYKYNCKQINAYIDAFQTIHNSGDKYNFTNTSTHTNTNAKNKCLACFIPHNTYHCRDKYKRTNTSTHTNTTADLDALQNKLHI